MRRGNALAHFLAGIFLALSLPQTYDDGARTPLNPADVAAYMLVWDDFAQGLHDTYTSFIPPTAQSVTLPISCGAWRVEIIVTLLAPAALNHQTGAIGDGTRYVSAGACGPAIPGGLTVR